METVEEWLHAARARGWKITGQVEKAPTTGTLHYQLMLQTPQMRFAAIKRAFPTAHIEIAKRKIALSQYVVKDATRIAELPSQDEKYPTAAKFWVLIYNYYAVDDTSGWDQSCEDAVRFYDTDRQRELETDPLWLLDQVAANLIRSGYVIDHLITNPAIRSFWKKFNAEILYRARETVRQTDTQTAILATHQTEDAPSNSGGEDETATEGQSAPSSASGSETASDGDRETDASTSDGEQDGWFQR